MVSKPSEPAYTAGPDCCPQDDVFGRLARLPALRLAALHLLSISLEGDFAAAEFEAAFKADPALTADLLAVANSPLFGLRSHVQSVRHAIALMGLEGVRSLALTITMNAYWETSRVDQALLGPWRHTIATAVIAEALGGEDRAQEPLLYTGGLLHDVGRLALFRISPAKYQQILSAQFGSIEEYLALEHALFQCGHDDAGAFLATAWDLPTSLCDCIRFHHCDIAAHAGQLFELVGIACRLADVLGYPEVQREAAGEGTGALLDLLPPRLRQASSLSADALRAKVETQLGALSSLTGPAKN
jgi:putative nucleotidyltransferase with HDIG domain